jgi:hypothetical protein
LALLSGKPSRGGCPALISKITIQVRRTIHFCNYKVWPGRMRRLWCAVAYCQDGQRRSTAKRVGFIPSFVRSSPGRTGLANAPLKYSVAYANMPLAEQLRYAPFRSLRSSRAGGLPLRSLHSASLLHCAAQPYTPSLLPSPSADSTPLARTATSGSPPRCGRAASLVPLGPLLALIPFRDAHRTPPANSQRGKAAPPSRTQPPTCTSASGSARSSPASGVQQGVSNSG